jgi:hypothetical protein
MYFSWDSDYFWFEENVLVFALLGFGIVGMSRGPIRWRDWFAVVLGMAILMSYQLELSIYSSVFFLAMSLLMSPPEQRVRRVFAVAAAISAAGLAMAAMFLSAFEYLPFNVRQLGLTFNYYTKNSLDSVITMIGMLTPFRVVYKITYSHSPYYIGLSVLWLISLALIRRVRGTTLISLSLILVFMAATDIWPIPHIMYRVPLLNRLIVHLWMYPLVIILVAVLGALGAQEAVEKGFESRWAWLPPAGLGLALVASAVLDKDPFRVLLLAAPATLAAAAVYRPYLLNSSNRRAAFIVAFVLVDITYLAFTIRLWAPMSVFDVHPEAREILTRTGLERFWPLSRKYFFDNHLHSNIGLRLDPLLSGSSSPLGYWRVPPLRLAKLINLACPGYLVLQDGKLKNIRKDKTTGPDQETGRSPLGERSLPLLSLMNVGWVLSNGVDLPEIDGLERRKGRELIIYRNKGVLPRVRAVSRWKVAGRGDEALAVLASGEMDFKFEAVVEPRAGDLQPRQNSAPSPHELDLDFRPGYWEIALLPGESGKRGEGGSLLIVAETLMPGWRAFLDGEEVPIHYAYHAFMGIMIPPGQHRLVMYHAPRAFRIGIWVSIFSMLCWPLMWFAWRKRRV